MPSTEASSKFINDSEEERAKARRQRHAAFVMHETLFRRNLLIAAALFVVSLIVYSFTIAPNAVAGEPADTLSAVLGVRTMSIMRHCLWRHIVNGAAALSTAHAVLAVNIVCMTFSSLAVALTYLFLAQLTVTLIDRPNLEAMFKRDPTRDIALVSHASGAVAALTLAFSAPYWFTATQCYFHSFYLAWLLGACTLLLRYAVTFRTSTLAAFCVLWGAGMSQTSCFWAWAPVTLIFTIYLLWSDERLSWKSFLLVMLGVFGTAALAFALNAFDYRVSAVHDFLHKDRTFWYIFKSIVKSVSTGVMGSLPTTHWLILLGLCVAPWLACLLVAKRAINGERGVAMCALHVVCALLSVIVIIDLRFSPWQFFDVESLQILPYCMMSLTFGYAAAFALTSILFSSRRMPPAHATALRVATLSVAGLLIAYSAWNNAGDADMRKQRAVWRYVDSTLDSLEGRPWLVTAGLLDNNLRLRAFERGIELHTLNVADPNTANATLDVKRFLPSTRLKNMAEVGLVPMIKEWIIRRDDADKALAFCISPDIWHMGRYETLPHGLVHIGIPRDEYRNALSGDFNPGYLDLLDGFSADIARVGETDYRRLRLYTEYVRRAVSFVGNNTGYFLDSDERSEDAFAIYAKIREFDPGNVACMLNWATLVQQGVHPECKQQVIDALSDFKKKNATPPEIWALASYYGYVSSPSAFVRLGWTWALSGQSNLAIYSLNKAIDDITQRDRRETKRIRALMADVYMKNGDYSNSEANYLKLLEDNPKNIAALIGLTRICAISGRFKDANEYLERAEKAGYPKERVLFERAAVDLAAGDIDHARVLATHLVELMPGDQGACGMLASVYFEAHAKATTDDERRDIVKKLKKLSEGMFKSAGPEDFRALFVRGRIAVLDGKFADARDDFISALQYSTDMDAISVLDLILRMDFALIDKGAAMRHAKAILARDADNALGNYILGSLALESERYESAEDYLQRALARNPEYIEAMNDLAMAKIYLRRIDEADDLVRKALELEKDNYGIWDTLGCVHLARKDYSAAHKAFDTAVKLVDRDPRVHLHLALALLGQGEVARVREIANKLAPVSGDFRGQDARDYRDILQRLLALKH